MIIHQCLIFYILSFAFQDSFLYEHLHKLGYTDFECVTIEKPMPKNEQKFSKLFVSSFSFKQINENHVVYTFHKPFIFSGLHI